MAQVRLTSTLEMAPAAVPAMVVVSSGRPWTRDFRQTLDTWAEQGVPVWGVVPSGSGSPPVPTRSYTSMGSRLQPRSGIG
jgi:chromosome partitioning protein